MSGESKPSDDPDFLDDDFVIEDLTGKQEDLDQLFTAPSPSRQVPQAPPDADDLLFTDHTDGLQASENFSGNKEFAEDAPSQWTDEGLDLESVGVPSTEHEAAAAAGGEAAVDPELREAEADFTAELGSLLQSEEAFGLDSEQELEVVGGAAGDGVDEVDQSGPFVLDDGDGAWQGEEAVARDESDGETVEAPSLEVGAEAGGEVAQEPVGDEVLDPVLADADAEPVAEGWEPLPSTSVDELAEVGGVERSDAEYEAAAEPALVGAAAVDGHDIYEQEPGPVLVGPRTFPARRRHVWWSLAASLTLVGGAAALVMRPEWFGLAIEPQRVEQVQVARPTVKVSVPSPAPIAAPAVTIPEPADPASPAGPGTGTSTTPTVPTLSPAPTGAAGGIGQTTPEPEPPSAGTVGPEPQATVAAVPIQPETPDAGSMTPVGSQPAASATPAVVEVPVDPNQATSWPVAQRTQHAPEPSPKAASPLVRIGEDLMVGEIGPAGRPANVVDGVMPGSRAFAQLNNGNYFIGSVKFADATRITLRVDDGEVTLATSELSRFTALGSTDYDELQKASSGFVRLTNNNRLVGGILSRIADDHIVLEFRSNRVMLPKSVVGEVVRGEDDAGIRLDVTREEDDWVKQMVERQLGTGVNPAETRPGNLPPPSNLQSPPAAAPPAGGGRR